MTISLRRRDLLGAAAAGATMAFHLAGRYAGFARRGGPLQPDLFIGTGGHGHTYPGATLPFGMVQLSPDTDNERWDACSGYHRDDTSIMGFSHTHLSGTGIGDMLDVLVVPTRGKLELEPGPLDNPDAGYRQRFSGEHAEPGYYRVQLESGVLAELTATERTGLHRYLPRRPRAYSDRLCPLQAGSPRRAGADRQGLSKLGWRDADRQSAGVPLGQGAADPFRAATLAQA
jgi:putative alpha-1,2-mannosidase